jgi:hypothetical protein
LSIVEIISDVNLAAETPSPDGTPVAILQPATLGRKPNAPGNADEQRLKSNS